MINVSNEFKTLMSERQDFKEYAEVTLANGTVLELTEDDFSIDNNSLVDSAGANSIPLGVALSRNVQLEIMNDDDHLSDYDFFGAKIRLYLTFELSSTTEKIEYGTFTVTQPETYGSVVTIVGYDDMYKADKTYSTTLTFPATAKSVLIDSCDTCGILIGNSNFLHNDFQIPTMPSSEYTHRQIIGFIAMIACGNARIDRTGHLQIITYDFDYSTNIHDIEAYDSLTSDTNDVQVTGVQMTKTVTKTTTDEDGNENEEDVEELVKYGSDGYVLEIENPLVAGHEETLVSWIYERFKDVTFRGFTMDYISYPIAEFGDKIKITDWKGKSFYSVLTDVNFVFFGYTTLQNSAESPMRNQSNYTSSEQKALIQGKELVEREKTNRENAIKKLNETLKSGSGLYSTEEKQPDGSSIYYLHDKRSLAESRNVIKLTSDAIGFSTDGGKNYPYGFTITGEMITRLLYAEGINADYINTGALTVKDKSGNIIFFADIETGTVRISGDNVTIGGKTATEAINDAINEAKKSRAMIINLDKDYQAIATDYKGEYTAFPECHTTAQVLYGHTDISNDCTYNVQKSSGVVGAWNGSTHTYTVTGLTTEVGWVDITANYLNTYSVTKRFDIAKLKGGIPGETGAKGDKGETGASGRSITSSETTYQASNSGTVAPTGTWSKTPPNVAENQYLWTRTIYTYSDNTTSTTYSIGKMGAKGEQGAKGETGATGPQGNTGPTGNGIKSTAITYQVSSSGTTVPTGTWSTNVPTTSAGQYLWTRTITTYTNSTTTTSYSVSRNGSNGAKGEKGDQGSAGRTYFMEPSAGIIKRSADSSMVPNYITLSGYYRDGTATARTAYKCRFKIEETIDGDTYKTVYTSSADETSITHSLYGVLATTNGGAIQAASNKAIGIPRDVAALRCTMYAAGGFTEVLDIETIPVAIDVDALTHEEIFNLLTNDGAWQGIYRGSDGKLYINFTYARCGALSLGGLDNANGELKMYDASNTLVGQWNKDGLDISKGTIRGSKIILKDVLDTIVGYTSDSKESLKIDWSGLKIACYGYPFVGNGLISIEPTLFSGLQISSNNDGSGKTSFCGENGLAVMKNNSKGMATWMPSQLDNVAYMNYNEITVQTGFMKKISTITPTEISTTGSKSRIIQTENYNKRLQYCYETPTPMFGDIGTAQTDETGKCYIDIDDVFQETVNTDVEYQVFLQKEGKGDLWIEEKTPTYFLVKGTENLKFSWELKVVQRDYEFERLEEYNHEEKEEEIDYEQEYIDEINSLIKEQEEMLNETT